MVRPCSFLSAVSTARAVRVWRSAGRGGLVCLFQGISGGNGASGPHPGSPKWRPIRRFTDKTETFLAGVLVYGLTTVRTKGSELTEYKRSYV